MLVTYTHRCPPKQPVIKSTERPNPNLFEGNISIITGNFVMNEGESSPSPTQIVEAIERATVDYKICPNRILSIARSFPQGLEILPSITPPSEKIRQAMELQFQYHENHQNCTIDLCEHSQLDFSSTKQRHENLHCDCKPLKDRFCRVILEQTAKNKMPTSAWKLGGKSIIGPLQGFMAISHVWSDGTGAGTWPKGEVNKCLYDLFEGIAKQFECEGIWWDTICIPSGIEARKNALNTMQKNYEDAKITLVHDCFLREWKWLDAETACFAILISPWFSRGWTALELAKSRRVKVMFGEGIIKDLDEDILAKDNNLSVSPFYKNVSEAISNLRKNKIGDFNELLRVLSPRHSSWPRDIAVIAGHLVGIERPGDTLQQITYQRILKKLGNVSHGHLFHNSATMRNGFGWCPTSILDMVPVSSENKLEIKEDGAVSGKWKVTSQNSFLLNIAWKDIHPLIRVKVRVAMLPENVEKHVFLVEPEVGPDPEQKDNIDSASRALLVEVIKREENSQKLHCRFVGSVHFHSPQKLREGTECWTVIIGHSDVPEREVNVSDDKNGGNFETSEEAEVRLLEAAASGNAKEVEELLGQGAHPDFRDEHSWTSLHYACWRGYDQVVKSLIEGGADQNIPDRVKRYPLHLAAERGWSRIVELLCNGRSDPTMFDKEKRTPLSIAEKQRDTSIADLLRKYGESIFQASTTQMEADISARNISMSLLDASKNGCASTVQQLLEEGTDIEVRSSNGQTALSWAARNGHQEMMQLLLEKGAKIDSKDKYGMTALLWAAHNGHLAAVELLLNEGAKLESKDDIHKETAIDWAARYGHETIMWLLMKKVYPSVQENSYDFKTLSLAAENGHEEVVRLFLERDDVDPNLNAIHGAAQNGHEGVIRRLLARGDFDPNMKTPMGWTALITAARYGQEGVVRFLLQRDDVDPCHKDETGWTALHWAAQFGHEGVIQVLLKRNDINANVGAIRGWTALMIAAREGHEGVVEFLVQQHDVDPNQTDQSGWTALHWAAQSGREGAVRSLLKCDKVDPYLKDSFGWTSLQHAISKGHKGIERLFAEESKKVISAYEGGDNEPANDSETEYDPEDLVSLLNGTWKGNYYYPNGTTDGESTFTLRAKVRKLVDIDGEGRDNAGTFTIQGTVDTNGAVKFVKSYAQHSWSWYYVGSVDVEGKLMEGSWGGNGKFSFRRA